MNKNKPERKEMRRDSPVLNALRVWRNARNANNIMRDKNWQKNKDI